MALTITGNNVYQGEFANEYFGKMFFGMREIAENHISVLTNVKKAITLPSFTGTPSLVEDTCTWNDQGQAVLNRVLTVKAYVDQFEWCYEQLEAYWSAQKMRAGATGASEPTFEAAIIDYRTKAQKDALATAMWSSAATGLVGIAEAELPGGQKIAGAAITPANVIAQMTSLFTIASPALLASPDARFFVSPTVWRSYLLALASSSGNANYNISDTPGLSASVAFAGIPVVPVNMGSSDMLIASRSAIYMGTDLLDDMNKIAIIDQYPITGVSKVIYSSRYIAGWQFAGLDDVYLYNAA